VTELRDHQGRTIRLTGEREAHILGHPEMAGLLTEIARTVREPEQVVRSRSDPAASLFYRWLRESPVGGKWLCVVVKYTEGDAFVLTAYLTDRPKPGEPLWPST